jgi:hypothetical protein
MENTVDFDLKKLEETNKKLVPLYQQMAEMEIYLDEKKAEIEALEATLLSEKEAKARKEMRDYL